jgi:hypothetical protein
VDPVAGITICLSDFGQADRWFVAWVEGPSALETKMGLHP